MNAFLSLAILSVLLSAVAGQGCAGWCSAFGCCRQRKASHRSLEGKNLKTDTFQGPVDDRGKDIITTRMKSKLNNRKRASNNRYEDVMANFKDLNQ
ncbi:hypothetical protein OS493_006507 [Desmophyllum pertusum]|uniref:Uncharacterized protein n=1 Tax=Desmophyllum pertusum TaxID=174260 RepID=A0A9X0DCB0_9CNID|nr:hypothetical protein OS493_006507 [Desmophyllum pertusum]